MKQSVTRHPTAWVPVGSLHFDDRIQRPEVRSRTKEIAAQFDPDAIGIIHVSERAPENYVVIDGQHRVKAMLLIGWGDQKVPCKVYEGLTIAQEAALFVMLNNTSKPQKIQKLLKSITAGEQWAVDIDGVLREHGLQVHAQVGDGHVVAAQALERIYNHGGTKLLSQTVETLTGAWGNRAAAFVAPVLEGMALVIAQYADELDLVTLTGKLSSFQGGPGTLFGHGKNVKEMRSTSIPKGVASVIVDLYNKGRRSGKIRSWWAAS